MDILIVRHTDIYLSPLFSGRKFIPPLLCLGSLIQKSLPSQFLWKIRHNWSFTAGKEVPAWLLEMRGHLMFPNASFTKKTRCAWFCLPQISPFTEPGASNPLESVGLSKIQWGQSDLLLYGILLYRYLGFHVCSAKSFISHPSAFHLNVDVIYQRLLFSLL